MNVISRRRLSRLEIAIAERNRRAPQRAEWLRQAALAHATKLVTLILHGDPQIEEPIAIAWRRALDRLRLSGASQAVLHDRLRTVVAALPGDTEIAKIAGILSSAPSWLQDFRHAGLDCCILGIRFPNSSESLPERGRDGVRDGRYSWPDLPTGTIGAGPRIPKSKSSDHLDALSPEEVADLIMLLEIGEENWCRRDRHRYNQISDKLERARLTAHRSS
jgi:hypothetical protein